MYLKLFFINPLVLYEKKIVTVILSKFRRTRTVPNSNFLLKIHWVHTTYGTIVLLLKSKIFLKKYHKIMRILRHFILKKYHKIMRILRHFMVFFLKKPWFLKIIQSFL